MVASRVFSAFVVPLGLLAAAYLAVPHLGGVPRSLSGLKTYGPHIAIALGMAVSVGLGRGRAFFALAILGVGHAVLRGHAGTTLDHAVAFAVPLNLALLAWQREKGVLNRQALRFAALLAAQAAVIAALARWYAAPLETSLLAAPLPGMALHRLATALGIVAATAAWLYRHEALSLALAAACAAFDFALRDPSRGESASLFVATAAVIVAVAVLQDLFRMALRDPLTGLRSRRALDEHFAALGSRYVIAMVDIDHFKRVNDTYGHDTGDQVLRMVARQLARVRGARAYRYGGEEFALVFEGRDEDSAAELLEALRESVADYPFRLRGSGREKIGRRGRDRKAVPPRMVSVTVSIGVAWTETRADPGLVLAAADKALYRAKKKGRNTLCR